MEPRPTPYDLVLAELADERFPGIRTALGTAATDARDRDAFLMVPDAVHTIRSLRPDDGLGEGIDQLAALVHHGYLFWSAGLPVLVVPPDQLRTLLGPTPRVGTTPPPEALYAQLPERKIWATVLPEAPPEPLDGCFVYAAGDRLHVLGVFGLHPERMGFSVVETAGPRPPGLVRPDRTLVFSPALAGGADAGLHSLTGTEELLELGWRTWTA